MSLGSLRPLHPFPARMAPRVVWDRLRGYSPGLTVLDPMVGSGTTSIAAQHLGHHAIGYDSDPLAVTIARAWCSMVDEVDFLRAACTVLDAAIASEHTAQLGFWLDDETRTFIGFWFDTNSIHQLAALSKAIREVRSSGVRDLLWCAFSRMIITKDAGVSLAIDVSHSRPHRAFDAAPVSPFTLWPKAVAIVAKHKFMKRSQHRRRLLDAHVANGDARRLPLSDESVDVVITSPPYLNAIDYLRGHRLSLVWMGHSIGALRKLRSDNIGAERGDDLTSAPELQNARKTFERVTLNKNFTQRDKRMIVKYVIDLEKATREVARVLRRGGKVIYVVGDCNLRGQFVQNSVLIRSLTEAHGLRIISTRRRPLAANRRYLPPPSSIKAGAQLQGRMGEEVILAFRKP